MSNMDDLKQQLQEMNEQGETHAKMISWLHSMGHSISERTLRRRFQQWGLKKNTSEPVTDHLLNRVQDLYQHGLLSDTEIAQKIADQDGLQPTPN
jgi:site-specific recombinase XerC